MTTNYGAKSQELVRIENCGIENEGREGFFFLVIHTQKRKYDGSRRYVCGNNMFDLSVDTQRAGQLYKRGAVCNICINNVPLTKYSGHLSVGQRYAAFAK